MTQSTPTRCVHDVPCCGRLLRCAVPCWQTQCPPADLILLCSFACCCCCRCSWQDKADDVKAGIRSTALTFGARSKQYLSGFAAANLALLALTGQAAGCGAAYYAGLAAAGGHLAWQIGSVDLGDRADCQAKFVSNTSYGALLFAGILADRLLLL
jgi:4-hydroxybenzoate polyprenyltransferase